MANANTALATAYVQIMPSFDGMRTSIQREVGTSLETAGQSPQATAAGRNLGRNMGSAAGREIGAALRSAATVGIAAVAAGVGVLNFAKAAEEAATADARLQQVATSMGYVGGAYTFATGRVQDYAEALSKKIAVDDESIKGVQAQLFTFKALADTVNVTGGAFDRATQAAFDLAATGIGSASSNAILLGKALQDPVRGLIALGKNGALTKTQIDEIGASFQRTGDIAQAQEDILKAIETQVKGVAEATANTSDKLAIAWGEFQEATGEALLPAVDAAAKAMDVLNERAADVQGAFKDIGQSFREAFATSGIDAGDTDVVSEFFRGLPNLINIGTKALQGLALGLQKARDAYIALGTAIGTVQRIDVGTITEKAAEGASDAAAGFGAYESAADGAADASGTAANAVDEVAAAYERMAARGNKALAALQEQRDKIRGIREDMRDLRFEASLYGLDDVTAGTRRLAQAQLELNAARRAGDPVGVAAAQREVLRQEIALDQARQDAASAAAEQARAAAEQAQEIARQARQSLADSISGDFVKNIVTGTADQIADALRGVAQNLKNAVPPATQDAIASLLRDSNARLDALVTERNAVGKRLEEAQNRLADLISARAGLVNQLRSQSFGSIIGTADEALQADADSRAPTASQARAAIVARLQQRVQQIRKFSADLKKLAARGLPQYLLNEIIQAGPDAGGPTAALLASSNDTEFNKIKSSAQQLYSESREVAKQGGKIMYDAGIESAKGLVAGLKAQEKAIQNQMIRIARMMVQTIRRALGIRSPSTVFAELGMNVGAGFASGITGTQADVVSAVDKLVHVPSAQNVNLSASGAAAQAPTSAGGFVVESLTINNPAPEPASTSVAGGLRRSAFMLGAKR